MRVIFSGHCNTGQDKGMDRHPGTPISLDLVKQGVNVFEVTGKTDSEAVRDSAEFTICVDDLAGAIRVEVQSRYAQYS
jgi:predicted mannosyl-3-phosphoglycerate phosphatase (HAD superfamily)